VLSSWILLTNRALQRAAIWSSISLRALRVANAFLIKPLCPSSVKKKCQSTNWLNKSPKLWTKYMIWLSTKRVVEWFSRSLRMEPHRTSFPQLFRHWLLRTSRQVTHQSFLRLCLTNLATICVKKSLKRANLMTLNLFYRSSCLRYLKFQHQCMVRAPCKLWLKY